jgi:hypothetical protein
VRAVLFSAVLLVAAGVARADELDEARRLEASLEYERALVLVDHALTRGGLDAPRLAQLHFEAGKLAAGLDHADAAADHFARALALDPSLALPAGTSPKVEDPFAAARARATPLKIALQRVAARVTVTADDPLHLVAGVQLRFRDDAGRGQELVSRDGPPFVLELPVGVRDFDATAIDDHGNHLYERHEHVEAPAPVVSRPHLLARWPVWAGFTGLALVASGISAWRVSVAQDDWNQLKSETGQHDYSELRAVEDRGRAWALAANIGFGVAAAGAIVTVLVYVRTPSRVAITAGPGTVGVAGRF